MEKERKKGMKSEKLETVSARENDGEIRGKEADDKWGREELRMKEMTQEKEKNEDRWINKLKHGSNKDKKDRWVKGKEVNSG